MVRTLLLSDWQCRADSLLMVLGPRLQNLAILLFFYSGSVVPTPIDVAVRLPIDLIILHVMQKVGFPIGSEMSSPCAPDWQIHTRQQSRRVSKVSIAATLGRDRRDAP